MLRRCVVWGVLCVIAAGCGGTTETNQLGPSAVTSPPSSGELTGRIAAQSIGSCPDGNAPSWLQTWTNGTTARLRWTEVAPTIDYHVVVERYDVTNQYVPGENGNVWTHNTTWAELMLGEGRYRAKVQTMSCGQFMGPWSETLQFSVEGIDPPATGDSGPPQESAEGTKVFPGSGKSLIDSSGDAWSFGAPVDSSNSRVLRNGLDMNGWGSQLKYHDHGVYHLGGDGIHWWLWNGTSWELVGTTEPYRIDFNQSARSSLSTVIARRRNAGTSTPSARRDRDSRRRSRRHRGRYR